MEMQTLRGDLTNGGNCFCQRQGVIEKECPDYGGVEGKEKELIGMLGN
jgi:hypothetical protein